MPPSAAAARAWVTGRSILATNGRIHRELQGVLAGEDKQTS